mgnify:CR=1 FL=1
MRRRHKRKKHKQFQPAYRRSKPKAAAGICPICGCSDLDYGDSDIQDESYMCDWICPACGRSGKECHNLVFDEHIVDD